MPPQPHELVAHWNKLAYIFPFPAFLQSFPVWHDSCMTHSIHNIIAKEVVMSQLNSIQSGPNFNAADSI